MAKRSPGLESPKSIIRKTIHSLGKAPEKKFYMHWVLWHWGDIVGEFIASHAEPQGIRKDVLYLYCYNAALRNELQMMMPQIVQQVNNYAGQQMITGIAFCRRWENPDTEGIDEIRLAHQEKEEDLGRERRKVSLTDEEMQQAAAIGTQVEDQELGEKVRSLYRKHLQMQKLRRQQDWHPCAECGSLCPPERTLCPICAARQREKLNEAIRQVLRDIPWAHCKEVQEYVPACTPKLLNDQRSAMVQQLAREVDVSDTESLKARNLVMLYRCLPPEQLTEEEIKRSLYRLRFNLHRPKDYKAPKRYSVIPLGRKGTKDRRQT